MFNEDSYPKDGFASEILAWFSQEVHKPKTHIRNVKIMITLPEL